MPMLEEVDGDVIVSIPMYFRTVAGKRQMVHAEKPMAYDGDKLAENAIVAAFARAYAWTDMLDKGVAATVKDLAEATGTDRPYMVRQLRLATLSPRILRAVMRGDAPDGITVEKLCAIESDLWSEQEREAGLKQKK